MNLKGGIIICYYSFMKSILNEWKLYELNFYEMELYDPELHHYVILICASIYTFNFLKLNGQTTFFYTSDLIEH